MMNHLQDEIELLKLDLSDLEASYMFKFITLPFTINSVSRTYLFSFLRPGAYTFH